MGLDQYAYRIKEGQGFEIAYWRKHNRLQGWMENLWVEKGKPNSQKDGDGTPIIVVSQKGLNILERIYLSIMV